MTTLTIHRGTGQIGGCCTEICADGRRILIDFGANLPGTGEASSMTDRELLDRVLRGRLPEALLFTHYHGDHCELYRDVAKRTPGLPMFIGPLARQILQVVTAYRDLRLPEEDQGFDAVHSMKPYTPGEPLRLIPGVTVQPFYVDHSALDAYMFYIRAGGKRILYTGDFRDHGHQGKQLWNLLNALPKSLDLLVTEGTTLGRDQAAMPEGAALSEAELGLRAAQWFRERKYNFVLVASTNMDSIFSFYRNTPPELPFVCDFYQARLIVTAMEGMQRRKGTFPDYQTSPEHPVIRVLDPAHGKWEAVRNRGLRLRRPLELQPIGEEELERGGFVLLCRKNSCFGEYETRFERLRDRFLDREEAQLIYSMWNGYLKAGAPYADEALLHFIGGRQIRRLHTGGHAYAETIAKVIETMNPRVILPMHTEWKGSLSAFPALAPYADRVPERADGAPIILEEL